MRKWRGAKIYMPQLLFPIADHNISFNIVQEGEIVKKDCVWSKKTVHRKREGASVAVPKLTVSKFHKYSLASIEYPHEGCTCTRIYTKKQESRIFEHLAKPLFTNHCYWLVKLQLRKKLIVQRRKNETKTLWYIWCVLVVMSRFHQLRLCKTCPGAHSASL